MPDCINLFAVRSDEYASARPRYPSALFAWLASQTPVRERAWDCATGNGQSAAALAAHYAHVCASDISAEQIAHATPRPNVDYRVASAENSGYPTASFDLIAVAQALHWFDLDRFWPEVRRTARPGAFFCAWGYHFFSACGEGSALVRPLEEAVAPFWSDRNRLLWRGYQPREIGFPFAPVVAPSFDLETSWTADELIAYVRTWSAYKRASADPTRRHDLEMLERRTRSALPDGEKVLFTMPLTIVAGYVTAP